MACELCPGVCAGTNLTPLLASELSWLWAAVAQTADRRGDAHMTSGVVTVIAPTDAAARSAATGLIGGRTLRAGQRVRVDLAELTQSLSGVGRGLTPGAVAAHVVGSRLAVKAREREDRDIATAAIVQQLRVGFSCLPTHLSIEPDQVIDRMSRTGWIARIRNNPDPESLVAAVLAVLSRLPEPGARTDRRTLVPGDPHALDSGILPSLVLALMGVSGQRSREAWSEVGVDIDDLVGGLIVTGVAPAGWAVPHGATMTLPPKELADVKWAPPTSPEGWVFVTENPSVLSAAVQAFREQSADSARVPRVVCTVGTPSQVECAAVAALAEIGWQVAVRADFDIAGLTHVRALLAATPTARPWRMSAADYLGTVGDGAPLIEIPADAAPWDTGLVAAMNKSGVPVFEEDLLAVLLDDMRKGLPGGV
jgi:uncharacterized protein (TIGR02679 family)